MKNKFSFQASARLFAIALVATVLMSSSAAFAQVEGCNPVVLDAMQQKAQAKVVYDTSVAEQITDKPDSVLAMTCFNQAAGVSGSTGATFSGDFTTDLTAVITPALTNFFTNYDDADGNDSGAVDYTAGAANIATTYNCEEMKDMWLQTEQQGVNAQVPFMLFTDLINGVVPAIGGDDFQQNLTVAATTAILNAAQTAMADPFFTTPAAPTITNPTSSCAVLVAFSIIPGPCP